MSEFLKLARKELKANRVSKAASLPSVSPSVCSANRLTAENSKMSSVLLGPSELVVELICVESMEVVITNESGRKRQLADKDGFVKPNKTV